MKRDDGMTSVGRLRHVMGPTREQQLLLNLQLAQVPEQLAVEVLQPVALVHHQIPMSASLTKSGQVCRSPDAEPQRTHTAQSQHIDTEILVGALMSWSLWRVKGLGRGRLWGLTWVYNPAQAPNALP